MSVGVKGAEMFLSAPAEEIAPFEVKFLVRLPAAAQQQVWPPVWLYPARVQARLTNSSKSAQGETSTHGNSSNPDASGDDHQTQQ
jgi:hypothetical protein